MIDKGIYSIDEHLYETASAKYIQNNRCVLGWKMIYDATVNGNLYQRICGIDIVPGDYIELGRNRDNPIRLKIGKPNKITISKKGLMILVETE